MKQVYFTDTATNGRASTVCKQASPDIKVTKRKQGKFVMLKQEKHNFKMYTRWLASHRTKLTTKIATNTVWIKERQKPHELRWLSRSISKKCPTANILRLHNRKAWIILLLTVITVHICHGSVVTHELTARPSKHQIAIDYTQFTTNHRAKRTAQYSQLLTSDGHWMSQVDSDSFRPIIPKDINAKLIEQRMFTETGQYRVFQPPTSDLREAVKMEQKIAKIDATHQNDAAMVRATLKKPYKRTTTTLKDSNEMAKLKNVTNIHSMIQPIGTKVNVVNSSRAFPNTSRHAHQSTVGKIETQKDNQIADFKPLPTSVMTATFAAATPNLVNKDMRELEALLVEYAESFFNQAAYVPTKELINVLHKNFTNANDVPNEIAHTKKRAMRHASPSPHHHHHVHQHHYQHPNMLPAAITHKADGDINTNIPRAMETGRLLFSSGLKKMLWPIFMGLQVLKSLMFALFLPTLIGSFGKLLGKGIVTGSAPLFIRPADAPQDLDFRDNTINFDDDKFAVVDEVTKEDGYAYSQAEASQTHYTYNHAGINRIEQQNKLPDTYLSALQTIGSASFKNSGSLSSGSSNGGGLGAPMRTKPAAAANTNNFQKFQKVPASSLLLSNYDPFYSPLLSRLDSVFAQLKLQSDNENCREKLICLMYANPAKYAPYSNLVSAQLSRELNELRKPTSDNPDILRFFKYMRAAKDGQDGVDCEKSFDLCKEFKDFENPAMVSTYHDINKLVQARKLT